MTKYTYGRQSWRNPDSKYGYSLDKLDADIQANQERYERKKQYITEVVNGILISDPVRKDETLSLFIEVLREIKIPQS